MINLGEGSDDPSSIIILLEEWLCSPFMINAFPWNHHMGAFEG